MLTYDTTSAAFACQETGIEVEIWEGYFLKGKSVILKTLYTYTLDNGPFRETDDGKMIFHFTLFDWQKSIMDLLTQNSIHYRVLQKLHINPLQYLMKKKVFVADDDPEIAACLSIMLEDAGYQVRVAGNGKSIVDGKYCWVDLFIVDKIMPDINGLEVCRHLRSQAATRYTPVILISALPQCGNEAVQAGATDYIEKPFHMHYLLNVVSSCFRNKSDRI